MKKVIQGYIHDDEYISVVVMGRVDIVVAYQPFQELYTDLITKYFFTPLLSPYLP